MIGLTHGRLLGTAGNGDAADGAVAAAAAAAAAQRRQISSRLNQLFAHT